MIKHILSIIILSMICFSKTMYAFNYEKGDAAFRELDTLLGIDKYEIPFIGWLGHAGIYRDFLGNPPVEPHDQRLIEMTSDGLALNNNMQTWINDVGENDVWGVKTLNYLTAANRRYLIELSASFINAEYAIVGEEYKNPLGNPPTFRCDGLVEYCYEVVLGEDWTPANEYPYTNGGLVANDVWGPPAQIIPGDQNVLSPLAMWHSDRWNLRTQGDSPQIEIRDQQGKVLEDGDSAFNRNITIYVTDGDYGSGLYSLELWQGNPEAGGSILKTIPNLYDVDHTYETTELNQLPTSGNIYIRSYDQAGNYSTKHIKIEPIIAKSLNISGSPSTQPILNVADGSEITIDVYAQTPQATLLMYLDSQSDHAIQFNNTQVLLDEPNPDPGSSYLYYKKVRLIWNGQMADGKWPSKGIHQLWVMARDTQGNESQWLNKPFDIGYEDTDDDKIPDRYDDDDDNDGIPDASDPTPKGPVEGPVASGSSSPRTWVELNPPGPGGSSAVVSVNQDGNGLQDIRDYAVSDWEQTLAGGSLASGRSGFPMSQNAGISLTASYRGGFSPALGVSIGRKEGRYMGEDRPVLCSMGAGVNVFVGGICVYAGSAGISYETRPDIYNQGDQVDYDDPSGSSSIDVLGALKEEGIDPSEVSAVSYSVNCQASGWESFCSGSAIGINIANYFPAKRVKVGGSGSSPGKCNGPKAVGVGSLLVADTGNGRIQIFTSTGAFVRTIGEGILTAPTGVAKDSSERIYAADGSRIVIFNENGDVLDEITGFSEISKIKIKNAFLYVADKGTSEIKVYDINNAYASVRSFGGGTLNQPGGVSVDDTGNIYAADTGNRKVAVFDDSGSYLYSFGDDYDTTIEMIAIPQGIDVDKEGNVYVADSENNRIKIYTSTGVFKGMVGYEGAEPYAFSSPQDVLIDPEGYLWVVDTGNDSIIKYQFTAPFIYDPPQALLIAPTGGRLITSNELNDGILIVSGTVKASQMDNWILYYGQGESPSVWNEFSQGSARVINGKLAELDTRALPQGIYSIKLVMAYKANNAGIEETRYEESIVNNVIIPKWNDFGDNFETNPENLFWIDDYPDIASYPWQAFQGWTMANDPDAHSGNSYYKAEGLLSDNSKLISPLIDLTQNLGHEYLTFFHKYNFSGLYGDVQISIDNGASWEKIFPVNQYPEMQYHYPGAYYGSQPAWQREVYDLSTFTGNKVRIRFSVHQPSGQDPTGQYWCIDDVHIGQEDTLHPFDLVAGPGFEIAEMVNFGRIGWVSGSRSFSWRQNGSYWQQGSYPYASNMNEYLYSPKVTLDTSSQYTLSFSYQLYTEQGKDGGMVEISRDNGTTWIPLVPETGYPGYVEALNSDGFSGTNPSGFTFDKVRFSLADYSGETVFIRFRFASDSQNQLFDNGRSGWYIDDIYLAPTHIIDDLEKNVFAWRTVYGSDNSPQAKWEKVNDPLQSHSGSTAWKATLVNRTRARLLSSVIDTTGASSATLKFWHKFSLPGSDWAVGWVDITTNNGTSWQRVYPKNGYTYPDRGGIFVYGSDWREEEFDISAYAGNVIRVSCYTSRDEQSVGSPDGYWLVDDVKVYTNLSDLVPPSSISDLSKVGITTNTVTLQWSATGDDGATGSITGGKYWIKYSQVDPGSNPQAWWDSTISELKWSMDTVPGNIDTARVGNLENNKNYWFALKTCDDAGNWSELSNVTTAKTLDSWPKQANFTITFTPDYNPPSSVSTLESLHVSTYTATLAWDAPGDNGSEGDIVNGEYWLKYSQSEPGQDIETWWSSAPFQSRWSFSSVQGQHEEKNIENLEANSAYWFALRVKDGVGNWSAISNTLAIHTIDPLPKQRVFTVSFTPEYWPPGTVTDLSFDSVMPSLVNLSWTVPGDNGGTDPIENGSFDIVYSTEPSLLPSTMVHISTSCEASTNQIFSLTGLLSGSTYFIKVRTSDGFNNTAGWSTVISTCIPYFIVKSTDAVISLTSNLPLEVIQTSTATPHISFVLSSATVNGLIPVSSIYDITPEGTVFSEPAKLVFAYDPALVPDPLKLAIYKWNGVCWSSAPITNQTLLAYLDPPQLIGEIHSLSLYGLFMRDTEPPHVSIQEPLGGEKYIVLQSSIQVRFTANDAMDNSVHIAAYLSDLEEGTTIQVSNGQILDPASIDDGLWTLTVEAIDWVGNRASSTTIPFEVIHDIMPPRTELETSGPAYYHDDMFYATAATQFQLSAVDDLLEIGDTSGTGVAKTQFAIEQVHDSSSTWQVYTASFSVTDDGEYRIRYYSNDNAGNEEEQKYLNIFIDNIAPSVNISSISSPTRLSTQTVMGSYTELHIATITVNGLYAEINESSNTYSCTLVFHEGKNEILVKANDIINNIGISSVTVYVDTIAPELVVPESMTVEATGIETYVQIGTATASDVFPVAITNNAPDAYALGVTTIAWQAVDLAGNISKAMQSIKVKDTTPPELVVPADINKEADMIRTIVNIGSATASDIFNVAVSNNAPQDYELGITSVTWYAIDANENIATKIQKINITDTTNPVITIPVDITTEAQGIQTQVVIGTATATDIFPVTITNNAPTDYSIGITTVTWIATDASGNKSVGIQKVTIIDTTKPAITAPNDLSVEATGIKTPIDIGNAIATDIFDVIVVNNAPQEYALGITTVIWTASDANGNESTAIQLVKVIDTTPPEMIIPDDITKEANAMRTVVSIGTATASDIFDTNITNDAPQDYTIGITTITWTVIDVNRNKTMKYQHINIIDSTSPQLFVPDDIAKEAEDIRTVVSIGTATVVDIFDTTIVNDAPVDYALGMTTVTWIATDINGNLSEGYQHIIIKDTTKPVLTIPGDLTIEATALATPVDIAQAAATDIFDVTVANDAPQTYNLGVTTVTWTATDVNGNISTEIQLIKVIDTTPPELIIPNDITKEAEAIRTVVNIGTATVRDIFEVNLTSDAPQNYALGSTTVTWTAIDTNGNKAIKYQLITIKDTTKPVLAIPENITIEATAIQMSVDIGHASAMDIFDTIITNDAPDDYALGTTTVIWVATDTNGNSTTAYQLITIKDTTSPSLSVPDDIEIEATGIETPVDLGTASASDIFGFTITNNAPQAYVLGITSVTWKAADINGNITTAIQLVTVLDTTKPAINITGIEEDSYYNTDKAATVEVTDNVLVETKTITLNGNLYESGMPITQDNNYIIQVSAIDTSGNNSDKSVSFVIDKTSPAITVSGITGGEIRNTDAMISIDIEDTNLDTQNISLDNSPFASGSQVTQEGGHTLSIDATDKAANRSLKMYQFTIDKTAPQVSIQSPVSGVRYFANISSITINFSVFDNLDLAPQACTYLTNMTNGATVQVNNNQVINPIDIPQGFWTFTVIAKDWAGNASTSLVTEFEVVHDTQAPVTAYSVVGIGYSTNGKIYINSQSQILLESIDYGTVVTGVKYTQYRINSGNWKLWNPEEPIQYDAEGEYLLEYQSCDNAGNLEQIKSINTVVDLTAPITTHTLQGTAYNVNGKIYVNGNTLFILEAEDSSAGTKENYYLVTESTMPVNYSDNFTKYTQPFSLSETDGTRYIYYFSIDNVENIENIKYFEVILNNTPPDVSLISPSPERSGASMIFNGKLTVIGTISGILVDNWQLEYRLNTSTLSWTSVNTSTVCVTEAVLGVIDTDLIDDGYYSIKLTATDILTNVSVSSVTICVGVPKLAASWHFKDSDKQNEKLFDPVYIAVDSQGNSYVTEQKYERIVKFDANGEVTDVYGGAAPKGYGGDKGKWRGNSHDRLNLDTPEGITVDKDGYIYVADRDNDRVVKLDSEGDFIMQIGGQGYGHWHHNAWNQWFKHEGNKCHEEKTFNHPTGVLLDSEGNIWISDRFNSRVQKFTPDGILIDTATIYTGIYDDKHNHWKEHWNWWKNKQFEHPGGIAIDNSNNIYVADQRNSKVLKFAMSDTPVQTFVVPASANKTFIDGLYVDRNGYIFITDQLNNKVYSMDKYGNFCMELPEISVQNQWNKKRSPSLLKTPCGITLDSKGMMYVVDRGNNEIDVLGLPETVKGQVASTLRYKPSLETNKAPGVPDTEFMLREIYAFPNPAKSGTNPKIRVAMGIADSVEITIYSLTGERVHSANISGSNWQIVNNLYCYDYEWDVSDIASGLYIYCIKADKAGKGQIKETKILAIIR